MSIRIRFLISAGTEERPFSFSFCLELFCTFSSDSASTVLLLCAEDTDSESESDSERWPERMADLYADAMLGRV